MRTILGALAGLIVTFVLVMGAFALMMVLFVTLEVDVDPAPVWLSVLGLGVGLVCALVGGVVAALVCGRMSGAALLAIALLVLGGVNAGFTLYGKPEAVEKVQESAEISERPEEPTWVVLSHPVVGCVGALLGGMVRKPKPANHKGG